MEKLAQLQEDETHPLMALHTIKEEQEDLESQTSPASSEHSKHAEDSESEDDQGSHRATGGAHCATVPLEEAESEADQE